MKSCCQSVSLNVSLSRKPMDFLWRCKVPQDLRRESLAVLLYGDKRQSCGGLGIWWGCPHGASLREEGLCLHWPGNALGSQPELVDVGRKGKLGVPCWWRDGIPLHWSPKGWTRRRKYFLWQKLTLFSLNTKVHKHKNWVIYFINRVHAAVCSQTRCSTHRWS